MEAGGPVRPLGRSHPPPVDGAGGYAEVAGVGTKYGVEVGVGVGVEVGGGASFKTSDIGFDFNGSLGLGLR